MTMGKVKNNEFYYILYIRLGNYTYSWDICSRSDSDFNNSLLSANDLLILSLDKKKASMCVKYHMVEMQ
jgi:hypothetical protein